MLAALILHANVCNFPFEHESIRTLGVITVASLPLAFSNFFLEFPRMLPKLVIILYSPFQGCKMQYRPRLWLDIEYSIFCPGATPKTTQKQKHRRNLTGKHALPFPCADVETAPLS